ncbi:PD-(D/E)XK motif protein [Dactylosporangium sp. McL0621]|uniref:PD-(D/E)XK motif protein n=1 Tax=Dactylosporangium sp. McL0621 TaxID=3415678 RepID=UPI003CE844BB
MSGSLRDLLRDHWEALAAEPIGSAKKMRVAALPVKGSTGPISAAVDASGVRRLLIPLAPNESVASAADSALHWRERGLEDAKVFVRYADLSCDRPDLADVFNGLCADILVAVEAAPSRPLKAARTVVARWRALFAPGAVPLGADRLAGLFGELVVLERLLRSHGGASHLWTGPSGHRHDFTGAARSIEVKTSTATEGRRVRIHGLDQLEEPAGGCLDLVWIRVEQSTGGRCVPALVDDLLQLADDEHDLLSRLAEVGYRSADRGHYVDVLFRVTEERWYEVGAGFPRVTIASLVPPAPPVIDVHYTIDLLADPVPALGDADIEAHVAAATGVGQ